MNRLLLAASLLACSFLSAHAANNVKNVLIHPGETVYARFDASGKKIKLTGWSTAKDESAQVVFTFDKDPKNPGYILKVMNKFPRNLHYRADMRSLSRKQHFALTTSPVVAGKVAFENLPEQVEQLAAFDFRLEK